MRIMLLLFSASLASTAGAATVTFTLDGVSAGCDDSWMEAGCTLRFVDTVAEDYTPAGTCSVLLNIDPNAPALMGARMLIDVSQLSGLDEVEIDIREASDPGRTRAFVYTNGGTALVHQTESTMMNNQTLWLHSGGVKIDTIAVSGHECLVYEVRAIGANIVANGNPSWSAIKALY